MTNPQSAIDVGCLLSLISFNLKCFIVWKLCVNGE